MSEIQEREHSPEEVGMDASALKRLTDVVAARGGAAQLCVLRGGTVVVDRAFGCSRDSLFLLHAATKPVTGLTAHLLAERGLIDLDKPVAEYWPRFAQHGKDEVTVRHVLQHRAGVPVGRGMVRTMRTAGDWARSVRDLEESRPRSPGGAVPAYHFMSFGFILGEVARRVTGRPFRDFMTSELFSPLGLDDLHLGLPDEAWGRHVPTKADHPSELLGQWVSNGRRYRQAVMPSAGLSGTAAQLARFYQMLLRGGELDGVRVLSAESVRESRKPSSDGEVDRSLKRPVRWSHGFMLGGPGDEPRHLSNVMGRRSAGDTFGHPVTTSGVAWADPSRDLVFVYLSSVQPKFGVGVDRLREVSDLAFAACADRG
ncbi:beta-lactamase family protein [Streptomyces durbertensis]|uniref:Beta-lactamase family protein n=1 Tax=Streptomyces durbertensis TaxID=2448886 RepID=A0ABR6EBW6_9ACTN|nr:serine hydrolase domain-containing protein [Streptomyces durbertensis]MBB1242738.1 beta-lactamase family protein [Streptomyces durbertensis]